MPLAVPVSRGLAAGLLCVFFMLLLLLPLAAAMAGEPGLLALADIFYRAGALVFGGGHVVLPILEAELVPQALIGRDLFLAGYGAAQAVPGPLFSFAGFVGWVSGQGGVLSALVCLLAMFGASFLLVPGIMPFWARLARWRSMRAALMGVNAAVVGLLAAALVSPIATSALLAPVDALVAIAALALLLWTRLPVWLIVAACAALGAIWL